MDIYLQLYYEPLNEEYEEMKYLTKDADRKLADLIDGKKVSSISIK